MEKYRYVVGIGKEQVELANLNEMIARNDVVQI